MSPMCFLETLRANFLSVRLLDIPTKRDQGLVMIVAAGLFVVGVGSLALIIRELRKAPEGYEDERGFHVTLPASS